MIIPEEIISHIISYLSEKLKVLTTSKQLLLSKYVNHNYYYITRKYTSRLKFLVNVKIDRNVLSDQITKILSNHRIRKLIIDENKNINDTHFQYLEGIHTLDMSCCKQNNSLVANKTITDKAFSYFKNIHTLDI